MCITLNNLILLTVECIKYLGIKFDSHFNFFTHIQSIEHKIFCFERITYKLKTFTSNNNHPPLSAKCFASMAIHVSNLYVQILYPTKQSN